jgi:hypothetical protein
MQLTDRKPDYNGVSRTMAARRADSR